MKQTNIAVLLFMLCALNLFGQSNKIDFTEYTLDNGLKVILHKDNSTPIVAISVMYHVGSKNERPDRTGFAHFFEHLLFEGTKNIPRGQYDKYVEKAGGTLNANTWYDRTFYFEIMPSNQLELGLWLEAERMLHAKVDSIGIATQKSVIIEERKQTVDNRPYGRLLEEAMKRAYTVHPYRSSVIGDMDHLAAAGDDEFMKWYKTYYIPSNAILSIAGDIDIEQTKKWVQEYYGKIPGGKKPSQPSIVEPNMTKEIRDTVYDNIQLPAIVHTYRIPAMGTPDFYAVSMLSQLLSQGESSRLYKAMVDETQLAVFSGSFPLDLEQPGVNIVYSIGNMGKDPMDVEKAMDDVVKKVQNELIPEREFQKLRNQVENDFISKNSRMAGISESLAQYAMYYGDANLINTELDRYLAVTREDIQRVARQYFDTTKRVSMFYLAKPNTP
jgi:zinc protease